MSLRQKFMLTLLLCVSFGVFAQQQQPQPLPIDPKVRYGVLDNGLTYYIRHNELPKDRADFYIAQKVGSILEEDSQAGLAHFLEHMAFNGTTNFPDKTMMNYLESIGVKFGENLNAYTGFDETVYMVLNVPTTRNSIIDSCLLVLHDWSGFITLDPKEIDKERGVIREEWRTRGNAQMRIWEQMFPQIYPNSKYANRLPIGSIDVINNFKPQEIRDYYNTWYRPDQQAIIVVGDVNVDKVEADIKKMFADIPKRTNEKERVYFPVPDNDEPIVAISKDKEATSTSINLFFKHDPLPDAIKSTAAGLVVDYMKSVAATMMNERFDEMRQKANAPFLYAGASDGEYFVSKTKDAWSVFAACKETGIDQALTAITEETERMKRYGFTPSEYDRARINVLKMYETQYNEREKQKNNRYAQEYVTHFTSGGYIPGIETEYTLINQVAPKITVEDVNEFLKQIITNKNIVISLTAPEKEGVTLPTKADLLAVFNKAAQATIAPYVDTVSNEPLMSQLPKAGKVVSESKDAALDATIWTLSNGAKVIFKTTDFKKDEITMSAQGKGGVSIFPTSDIINTKVLTEVVSLGGLGKFSQVELTKMLAGKLLSVTPYAGAENQGINASTNPKDLETMMQLVYMTFTQPRMDQEAFDSYMERMKAQLLNAQMNPMVAMVDSINKVVFNNNPWKTRFTVEDLSKINYAHIMDMYKELFASVKDYNFIFVGNIDPATLKPLVEQYIASLPAAKAPLKPTQAAAVKVNKGEIKNVFNRAMQTPKATVLDFYSGSIPYTLENMMTLSFFDQILDILFTEKVREEQGGTYGVSCSAGISRYPMNQTIVQIYFDTDPEKYAQLNEIVKKEIKNMTVAGPRAEDFSKVKEFMLKKRKENLQENGFWMGVLSSKYNQDFDSYTQYDALLNAMTPEKVKQLAKKLIDQNNQIDLIMLPEAAK